MTRNSKVPPVGQVVEAAKSAQVLKINQVCSLTQLSKATVYRLAARGLFVRPIKTGIRASGWRLSEVQAWLDAKAA